MAVQEKKRDIIILYAINEQVMLYTESLLGSH